MYCYFSGVGLWLFIYLLTYIGGRRAFTAAMTAATKIILTTLTVLGITLMALYVFVVIVTWLLPWSEPVLKPLLPFVL